MNIKNRLESKLESMFPCIAERKRVIEALNEYSCHSPEATVRVHLAILKLASREVSVESIKKLTQAAQVDYRDILAWAEYPRSMKYGPAEGVEAKKLSDDDLREYQTWLKNQ